MLCRYLTIGVLLTAITVNGQTKDEIVPKPEIMSHFYYKGDSNQLNSLEKGKVMMNTKMKVGGFAGSSSSYDMEGTRSSFRIVGDQPQFVIKMSDMMGDPANIIRLYKFDIKNNGRKAMISSVGVMGTGSKVNQEGIPFQVKSYDNGVFIFIAEKRLDPGEYGFINLMATSGTGRKDMAYTVFTFGIDR